MDQPVGGLGVIRKVLTGFPGSSEVVVPHEEPTRLDAQRLDQSLADALDRIRLIRQVDELWDARVIGGQLAYDEADEQEIQGYYRDWLVGAERLAIELNAYLVDGLFLVHADEFSARLATIRDISTPDEVFFDSPELVELRDRALDALDAGETVEIRDLSD